MEQQIGPFMALFLASAAVGVLARRLQVPYTLALVIAGVLLGALHLESLHDLRLTPDLVLVLLLPPLLFEASFHLDWARLRRDAPITLVLAGPGVLLSTAATATIVWALFRGLGIPGLALGPAFLLGAIVSATDPVSVLALFKTLGVDRRLRELVEAESLLNDGVAVVAFLVVARVLGIGAGDPRGTTGEIALDAMWVFAWMTVGGVAIGAATGFAASVSTRAIDDPFVEVTVSVLVAWGSYLLADAAHASGVLACVAAGVVYGNVGGRQWMSSATRVAVADFWGFLVFFANTVIFLLIGLGLDARELWIVALPIAIAWGALVAARVGAVGLGWVASRRLPGVEPVPAAWVPVLVWGGLRGGLSMVLAIGLPADYAPRALLLPLVFGVTAATLLLQGLTMPRVLRMTGVSAATAPRVE
jgi:CPA1 family monovalent cation:H+ antiporter